MIFGGDPDGTRGNVVPRHPAHRLCLACGVTAQAYTTRATARVGLFARAANSSLFKQTYPLARREQDRKFDLVRTLTRIWFAVGPEDGVCRHRSS